MTKAEERSLLGGLERQLQRGLGGPGADPRVIQLAVDHLKKLCPEGPLQPDVPHTFDAARFAAIKKNHDGGVTASFGIGRDSVGTIATNSYGDISWETHTVAGPGSHADPHPMAIGEYPGLAKNLEKFLATAHVSAHDKQLWEKLLAATKKF